MVRPPNLMRAFDPPPVTLWRRSERPAARTTATLGPVEPWPLGRPRTPTRRGPGLRLPPLGRPGPAVPGGEGPVKSELSRGLENLIQGRLRVVVGGVPGDGALRDEEFPGLEQHAQLSR